MLAGNELLSFLMTDLPAALGLDLPNLRRQSSLKVGTVKVLIFQGFSALLLRKAFSPICRYLHDHAIKFHLLYPTKRRAMGAGRQLMFADISAA